VDLEAVIANTIRDHPLLQPSHAEIEIDRPLLPVLGFQAFVSQILSIF